MNIFTKAKTMLANLAKNIILHTSDRSRVVAGKALVDHQDRLMTPPEWIRWYLNGNRVPLKRPGAPYVNRGYKRRQGPNEQRIVGPNYRKQANRVARALRKFNGEPASPFVMPGNHDERLRAYQRDALTGIVS